MTSMTFGGVPSRLATTMEASRAARALGASALLAVTVACGTRERPADPAAGPPPVALRDERTAAPEPPGATPGPSEPASADSSAPSPCGPIDRATLDEEPGLFDGAEDPADSAGEEVPARSQRDACALGCVLVSPDGAAIATVLADVEESGIPERIDVVRFDAAGGASTTSVRTSGLSADALEAWLEEDGSPPWAAAVARAMGGTSAWTALADVAGARGTIDFSISSVSVVRALGAPLSGWLLFAESASEAVRLELVRRDCSDVRLVGSLPLTPGACDGDGGADLCVVPPSIERVFVTPDAAAAYVQIDTYPAGHGGAYRQIVRLSLGGYAATVGTPSAELVRSLVAPGARPRWLGPWAWHEPGVPVVGPEPLAAGALTSRCDWECVFFGGEHTLVVHPTEVTDLDAPTALVVTRDGVETRVTIDGDPSTDDAQMPWHAQTVAALGALEGFTPATDLVRREAIASDGGILVTPLVELGAPLEGEQLWLETEGERYALRRRTATTLENLGSVPVVLRDGAPARAGIARVYASSDRSRLVVLAYARTAERTTRFFPIVVSLASDPTAVRPR